MPETPQPRRYGYTIGVTANDRSPSTWLEQGDVQISFDPESEPIQVEYWLPTSAETDRYLGMEWLLGQFRDQLRPDAVTRVEARIHGRSTVDDTITAIDRATGCQQCGRPLDWSPSTDFCSQDCQTTWNTARSEPLIGYQEPFDLPVHYTHEPAFYDERPVYPLGDDGSVVVPRFVFDASGYYEIGYGGRLGGRYRIHVTQLAAMAVLTPSFTITEWPAPAKHPEPPAPAVRAENWFTYTDTGGPAALEPQMPVPAPLPTGRGYELVQPAAGQFARRGR